jgi:hypothetical protein
MRADILCCTAENVYTRHRAANTTTVRRAEAASSPTLVLCVQPKESATYASCNVKWEYSDNLQNKINQERGTHGTKPSPNYKSQ